MGEIKLEFLPCITDYVVGEVEVTLVVSEEEYERLKLMPKNKFDEYVKSNGWVKITDSDIGYDVPNLEDMDIYEIPEK
jgi:hypothetical protein